MIANHVVNVTGHCQQDFMTLDPSLYVQEVQSLTSGNAKRREAVTASFDWGLEKRGEQCIDCEGKTEGYERINICENCDWVDADYERYYCCSGLGEVSTLDCFGDMTATHKAGQVDPRYNVCAREKCCYPALDK